MLLFTITFGSLLMVGHQARGESLFYYFRLEDQVPENHLLRLIDRHVNFEFIRAKLKDCYSDAGRPSIVIAQNPSRATLRFSTSLTKQLVLSSFASRLPSPSRECDLAFPVKRESAS
jgi:hypothetical protein